MRLPARLTRLPLRPSRSPLALAGCSDGGEDPDEDGPASPTETAEAEPYLPVPDGVELTAQGSTLARRRHRDRRLRAVRRT